VRFERGRGRAYARKKIPAHTPILSEFPIAFTEPDDIPEIVFNSKFLQRDILVMCCQMIRGNEDFARSFAARYKPNYTNPILPPLVTPKPGDTVSPLHNRWASVISFLGNLETDKESLKWWKRGTRLERLHDALAHLTYSPSDLLTNVIGDALGVWLSISQVAHACADQANCVDHFELIRNDSDGEIEKFPLLTLYTTRDIERGEEITWSRFAGPFGVVNNLMLREAVETQTGLECNCAPCKERRELRQHVLEEKQKRQRQAKAAQRNKKKKANQRKRRKNSARAQKNRNGKQPSIQVKKEEGGKPEVKNEKGGKPEVTMVLGPHGTFAFGELSGSPGGQCAVGLPMLRLDHLRKMILQPLELQPGKNGRPPAPTWDEVGKTFVGAEIFSGMLQQHIEIAYEKKQWLLVMELCDMMRESFDRVSGLMVLLVKHRNMVRGLCEKFLGAQNRLMGNLHPYAWWWAALNFRLMTTFCKEVRLRLASCYAGIVIEMRVLYENKEDKPSAERMVCYYSRLCDELEKTFGDSQAISIRNKELCRKPMFRTEDGDVEALAQDIPMSAFLVYHYKLFCEARELNAFEEEDEEAVRLAAEAAVPQFYPLPVEGATRLLQAHIKAKILNRQWKNLRAAVIKAQGAIRNFLVMRRMRNSFLAIRKGALAMQGAFRVRAAKNEAVRLRVEAELGDAAQSFQMKFPAMFYASKRKKLPSVERPDIAPLYRSAELFPHVIVLQARVRKAIAAREAHRRRQAVLTIQTMTRGWLAREELCRRKEDKRKRKKREEEEKRKREERKKKEEKEQRRRIRQQTERKKREEDEALRIRQQAERKKREEDEALRIQQEAERKKREEEEEALRIQQQAQEQQRLRIQQQAERKKREEEEKKQKKKARKEQRKEEGAAEEAEKKKAEQEQRQAKDDYLHLKRQYYLQQQKLALIQHHLAQMALEMLQSNGGEQAQTRQEFIQSPSPPQQYGYYNMPHPVYPLLGYSAGYYCEGMFYPPPPPQQDFHYYYEQQPQYHYEDFPSYYEEQPQDHEEQYEHDEQYEQDKE